MRAGQNRALMGLHNFLSDTQIKIDILSVARQTTRKRPMWPNERGLENERQ